MTADLPDWMSPAQSMLQTYFGLSTQIAALIATGNPFGAPGGVPLLAAPVTIYNAPATLAAGAVNEIIDDVNGQTVHNMEAFLSYEIAISQACDATADSPFILYQFSWYADAAATILVYQESWSLPGASNRAIEYIGSGPVRGAYLVITQTNFSSVHNQYVTTFAVLGNARPSPMLQPDWRSTNISGAVVPGYLPASYGRNVDGVLGYASGSIPFNDTQYLLFGLYNGQVELSWGFSGSSGPVLLTPTVNIYGAPTLLAGGPETSVAANASGSQIVTCSRTPLIVQLINQAASGTANYFVTAVPINQF